MIFVVIMFKPLLILQVDFIIKNYYRNCEIICAITQNR